MNVVKNERRGGRDVEVVEQTGSRSVGVSVEQAASFRRPCFISTIRDAESSLAG